MRTEHSDEGGDGRTVALGVFDVLDNYERPTLTALGTAQEAVATQQSFFIPPPTNP